MAQVYLVQMPLPVTPVNSVRTLKEIQSSDSATENHSPASSFHPSTES